MKPSVRNVKQTCMRTVRKAGFSMGREDICEEMSLKARIAQALKDESEDTSNEIRLHTLRLIDCAIRDRDVSARGRGEGQGCPEAAVRDVLETMIDQREEAAKEHDDEGRMDEAIREREEIEVIRDFLPRPLGGNELETAVARIVAELGATKLKDLGRCMSALKERYPGLIETGPAGRAVRDALSHPPSST